MFHIFFFDYLIEGVLLHDINTGIEGEKFSYRGFLVYIGVWSMMAKIQGWQKISYGGYTIMGQ